MFSKKYGVDLIRYAHGDTETVVYSSNKLDGNDTVRTSIQVLEVKKINNKQQMDTTKLKSKRLCPVDTIRYLSLSDNKYIRYFPGHTAR